MRISHVLLASLAVSIINCCSILANQPMRASEQSIEQLLSSWSPTELELLSCLQLSLNKGLFDLAETLVSLSPSTKHSVFHAIYNQELKRLTQFSRSLVVGWTRIAPVIKWAQSNDTVLVSFKLSHRWDSPPCTATKSETHKFQDNRLEYMNQCIVSRQRIYFGLNMTFWADLEDNGLEVRKDGVGTYTITLKKKTPQIWPYLDQSKHRYPVWGEIADRYKATMEAYANMIEKEEESAKNPEKKSTTKAELAVSLLLVASMLL